MGIRDSTLVQLIPRLYDVTSGRVLVGGRDVRDYSLEHLRNTVAMVLQQNTLFSGTIRENLLWGDESASDEEIWAACQAACADEFISRMPQGLETDLGQGGVNVSGGQKQRLCIARAILKKPKVLILEDVYKRQMWATLLSPWGRSPACPWSKPTTWWMPPSM